jgi:NAD(P)-dependent dehydrogenase (short-subunit alcohol dehydrogenase family)
LKNLSILIHCAGVSQASLLHTTSQQDIEEIITTNLTGPIMLTQSLIRPLIKNKPSSVTFLSSVLGLKGLKGTSVYATSKSGIQGFSRAMARELGSKHIRFNCVSPGLVKSTSMGEGFHFDTALDKDSVSIDEVVSGVLLMVENDGVTGQNLVIDNGYIC